jgi:hypothetical protein
LVDALRAAFTRTNAEPPQDLRALSEFILEVAISTAATCVAAGSLHDVNKSTAPWNADVEFTQLAKRRASPVTLWCNTERCKEHREHAEQGLAWQRPAWQTACGRHDETPVEVVFVRGSGARRP